MSSTPIGPMDRDEPSPPTTSVNIEIDADTIDAGQRFLSSVTSGQIAGADSPLNEVKIEQMDMGEVASPGFMPDALKPRDTPAVEELTQVQTRRSEIQQVLEGDEVSRRTGTPNQYTLPPGAREQLEEEQSLLEDKQREIAKGQMDPWYKFNWTNNWPWVQAFIDADNRSEGVLDNTLNYLDSVRADEGIPYVSAGVNQILGGTIRALGDFPGRVGDTIYDMVATDSMRADDPKTESGSTYTRPFGSPDSIAGSLGYYGVTYIAPFLAGAGAGSAIARGASFAARFRAGVLGGFAVNRATDITLDPYHEGSASAATRQVIADIAAGEADPNAFLDQPRFLGVSLREFSDFLEPLDSREYAKSDRFAGRIAVASEGALLDLIIGPPLVLAGMGLAAAGRGAARSVRQSMRAGRRIDFEAGLRSLERDFPAVRANELIESIDGLSSQMGSTLRAQGRDPNSVADMAISHYRRYLNYVRDRLARGAASNNPADTPAQLLAPFVSPELTDLPAIANMIRNTPERVDAGMRLAAVLAARRAMAERYASHARERRWSRSVYASQDVDALSAISSTGATRFERQTADAIRQAAADAGGSSPAVSEGVPNFSRISAGDADRFHDGISETQRTHKYGPAVEVKEEDFYRDPTNRMFMSDDGSAGASVTPEGDLVSVFKKPGSSVDVRPMLAQAARHAITGDAFDIGGFLPSLYADHGFRVASRVRFNDEFMPPGWNIETMGRPDIVMMIRDPDGRTGLPLPTSKDEWVAMRDSIPVFDDWSEAASVRDQLMDEHRIRDSFSTTQRMRYGLDTSPDPMADQLEIEQMLDEVGLGLKGLEGHTEEYLFQTLIDPANGLSLDPATARMQARYAVRFGQMAGVNVTPDTIRSINAEIASQIINTPYSTAKVLFQRKGDEFRKSGKTSEMLQLLAVPPINRGRPGDLVEGVDLNNVVGNEAALVLRPRLDTEHLRTMKGGRYVDLPSLEGTPEMAGMRPITDDEILQIHRDSIREMVEAELLPQSLMTNGSVSTDEFQKWARKFVDIPDGAKEWTDRLGAAIASPDGRVSGFREMDAALKIGVDFTDGMTIADIEKAAKKKHLTEQQADYLISHIKSKPAHRQLLGMPGNAELWNQAVTSKGADRHRFWYQRTSERFFGDVDPLIKPDGMPEGWKVAFNNILSITSARTAPDENFLRTIDNFASVVLDETVPVETEAMGRKAAIRIAALGRGTEDADNYKVNNFNFANSRTLPRSELPFVPGVGGREALDPSLSHIDLPVNDVIMAKYVFNMKEDSWSNFTMYQLGVRMERRIRNLLNARRAELEATNPLESGPREVWEMAEVQAAPWGHWVSSGVDSKAPTSPLRNNFIKFGLAGKDGAAPEQRKRASDFVEAFEQAIEVLSAHPDTKHYYDPTNPNRKIYDSGVKYMDIEVLTDPKVRQILQPASRSRANSANIAIGTEVLDRLAPAGQQGFSERLNPLLRALNSPAAQSLNKTNYNVLLGLYTTAMDRIGKVMGMLTRNREQPTPTGKRGTVAVGELIAAMLGRKQPEVSAALTDENAIVRASYKAGLQTDDKLNPFEWRVAGPMSIDASNTARPEFTVSLQTLQTDEQRRVAAAAVALATGETQSVFKYIRGPVAAQPHRGRSQSFEAVVASSDYQTIRNLNSKNAAVRQEAEQNTVVVAEILHPTGNQGVSLVDSMRTSSPGGEIFEQGGTVVRFRGNSKREIMAELASKAEEFGITQIRIDAMDADSFTVSPEQARELLAERMSSRISLESSDQMFLDKASHGIKQELMPVLRVIPTDMRSRVLTTIGDTSALRSEFIESLQADGRLVDETRSLLRSMRQSFTPFGDYDSVRDEALAVAWKAAGFSIKYSDDGSTFRVTVNNRVKDAANSGKRATTVVAAAMEKAGKQFDEVVNAVRGMSAAHRQAWWLDRMRGIVDEGQADLDFAYDKFTRYNENLPPDPTEKNPNPKPKGAEVITAAIRRNGFDDSPFMRFQQVAGDIRGVTFSPEGAGMAFIRGFGNADASTGIEELTHAVRVLSTTRGINQHPSYTQRQWESLAMAAGANKDGSWSIGADEELAGMMKELILQGKMPASLPSDAAWTLSVMAAEVRDVWRDATAAGAAGVVASGVMRQDVIRRLDTMSLPIRVGPGKYHPAVDWSKFASHAASLRSQGLKWQDVINPSDVLAHARIFEVDGRPVLRDPVTGMFIRASDRDRTLSDAASRAKMKSGTHFPKGTRDEMFTAMAYFEDFVRFVRNSDPLLQQQSIADMRDNAVHMFARLLNQPDDTMYNRLDDLMKVDLRQDQLSDRVTTVNMFMKFQLHNVVNQAKRADKTKDALDYAMLDREFRLFQQAQHYSAQFATQLGRGLRALRDPIQVPTRDTVEELVRANKYMGGLAAVDARGRDLVEMLRGLDVENFGLTVARQIELANQNAGSTISHAANEVYVNALLSSPRTFLGISVAGPAMMTMVQGMERVLGSIATGNMRELGTFARNFKGMVLNTWTAMKYAAHAFKDEAPRFMDSKGLLDQVGTRYGIAGDAFGMKDGLAKSLVDLTGVVIRSPSRVIMTVDEFFRQLHGRQAIYMDAFDRHVKDAVKEAYDSGLITSKSEERTIRSAVHDDAKRFAEREVDRMIRDGRLRTKDVLQQEALDQAAVRAETDPLRRARAVMQYMQNEWNTVHRDAVANAEDYATRAVFQNELGDVGRLGAQLLAKIPGGRILVPFYRTPVNIITRFGGWLPTTFVAEGIDRALHGFTTRRVRAFDGSEALHRKPVLRGIHQQTLEDLFSGDPRRKAEARGRQAFGVGLVSLGWFLAANGSLTGSGPRDPDRRRAWSQTNQPYSIRLPNGDWVSYQKMDPIGMHLGLLADAMELLIDAEFRGGINEEKTDLVNGLVYAFGQQLRKAPYLQGVTQLMDALENNEKFGATMIRRVLTSAVPFSSAQRSINSANDDAFREVRSLVDAYRAWTWFGDADNVPVARTPLGEELTPQPTNSAATRWANWVNPMMYMQESDDLVYKTINDLGMVLDMPEERTGNINWAEVAMPDYKFSAYDWWLERIGTIKIPIEGTERTLREHLTDYFAPDHFRHKQWQSLLAGGTTMTGENAAVELVRDIVAAYREAAFDDMIRRNPAAAELMNRILEDQYRQGQRIMDAEYGTQSDNAETLTEVLSR